MTNQSQQPTTCANTCGQSNANHNCQDNKPCGKCGNATKSGMKYENVCTVCEPVYLNRCSGCQRILWDCMCIKPHTWE